MQVLIKMGSSPQIHYAILSALLSLNVLVGAEKVITASRGETVLLPCRSPFDYSNTVSVEWKKDGESGFCKYRMSNNKTRNHDCKSRFKVNADPIGLIITDVTGSDAGVYTCSMSRVIPPPAVQDFSTLILQVNVPAGLIVQQVNISNQSCVELLCSLEGLSPEQVNFTWSRESEQLLHQNNPSNMSSTLTLCKPHWRDGDTFTCQASYSSSYTLYSKSFTIKYTDEECPHCCPAIHICQISSIIVITFVWILHCICSRGEKNTNLNLRLKTDCVGMRSVNHILPVRAFIASESRRRNPLNETEKVLDE